MMNNKKSCSKFKFMVNLNLRRFKPKRYGNDSFVLV